jgi:hypothetical protein
MNTILQEPRNTFNKVFLKIKPNRTQIENFKNWQITKLTKSYR